MRARITALTFCMALAPVPLQAQDSVDFKAFICLIDSKVATFVFHRGDGQISLLGHAGAIVSESDPSVTVVANGTVYQLQGDGSVQVLEGGKLSQGQCAEMTDEVLQLGQLQHPDGSTVFATAAIQQKLEAAAMALQAEAAAAEALREKLKNAETAGDRRAALLAAAQKVLTEKDQDLLKSAQSMALLNQQLNKLRAQLGGLQAVLDVAAEKDSTSKVQIEALGSQLNAALAQVASEQKRRADLEEAERKRLAAEKE